jgi:Fanconi anemia group M protein
MKTIKTKQIFNIFSKREKTTKRDNNRTENQKIIIDYREKNSLVPSSLKSLGLEIEFKELKVADYIVRNVAIERKTISDFISSMLNKRLSRQLEELQQYEKKLLIIEGTEEKEIYNDEEINSIHPNAIRGFLLTILLKHNIPVLFTKNPEDTAKFINLIACKKTQESSTRAIKKSRNKQEQLQYILEGFPGIGPKTSKKLLKHFKSLKNIINASEEELKEIINKKGEIIHHLLKEEY